MLDMEFEQVLAIITCIVGLGYLVLLAAAIGMCGILWSLVHSHGHHDAHIADVFAMHEGCAYHEAKLISGATGSPSVIIDNVTYPASWDGRIHNCPRFTTWIPKDEAHKPH
jgi:hypothetical protein